MRCQEPIGSGRVAGTCEQRGADGEPLICEDFSAMVDLVSYGSCEETLPTAGFKLAGCGFDDICFARQRGCVWDITCESGAYAGIASGENSFELERDGRSCEVTVVDGKVEGSCSGSSSCRFGEVEPAFDSGCYQIPAVVLSSGCGGNQLCQVLQDGCQWAAMCSAGALVGTADEDSISWLGLVPEYICRAELAPDGTQMNGNCTRENPDGSVSECRDLTDVQDDRLVLTFPESP